MRLKKIIIGTTLALLSLPLIANAGLETWNYTKEDSSVKVTSGSLHHCSLDYGVYTAAADQNGEPGKSSVGDAAINGLCLTSKGTCTADIYNSKDCSNQKIGEATMSLATKTVTDIRSTDTRYKFTIENGGTKLIVKYASQE